MLERNVWPQWLKNLMPNWLENISYPTPGVGDLNDLKFFLGVGNGGKWIGFVNSGWFYHDNTEQFNYIVKGQTLVAATSGTPLAAQAGFTVSNAVSGTLTNAVSFRPSWGPIIVNSYVSSGSTNNYQPYILHNNSFYPGVSLSWTASGNLYYSTLPGSSLLIGMRDLTNLAMGSVTATGQLLSERLFYYDQDSARVWVKPRIGTAPSCWADIVYFQPKLKFREIVTEAVSGVKASYRDIENISCFKGDQIVTLSNKVTGGAYFTHSLSGVSVGDWVGLEYYITKSYIVRDHRTIEYYVSSPASGDNFVVSYETSLPNILKEATLALPVAQSLNFNPIYSDSFRSGFLFHSNPTSSITNYWTPSDLKLFLDKAEVCGDYNEPIHMSLYAFGDNGLPLPNYSVSLAYTPTASVLTSTASVTAFATDGRGELHVLFQPASGTTTFSVTGTVATFSSTASAAVKTFTQLIDSTRWQDGFVNILVTDDNLSNNSLRTYVNAITLDGIPRAAVGDSKIILRSEKASEFSKNGVNYSSRMELQTSQTAALDGLGAIADIGLIAQDSEHISAISGTAQALVIKGEPNNGL